MVARIKALHAGIILAGGLFVSSSAFSLVLGDITLSSALNEPLNAVIELDSLEGLDAAAITVTIGDQEAYDRVAIDRDPFLDNIQFTVEVDNDDEGRIVLTSTENVTEPFLNVIVSVAEPDNVTLKEYTLLVELPDDSEVSSADVAPPVVTQNEPAPAVTSNTPDSYTVSSGDTMFEIAANVRPDDSVSVQQMMVAIQRANPDAFIGGNINRLINGRVLRIPSAEDIRVIDQQSAVAQVSAQNTDLGGQPLATGNTAANGGAADTRDQLRVLSGDADAGAGGGSSDLAATITSLENALMLSEESLDRARIENLELNNRLSSLQEQIDLLENIIAIEDERIATLQAELAQQTTATETALASANTAATALDDINSEPASGLTGLLQNTVVILGAVLVLVLLVAGFLYQRRKQALAAAEERSFNPAFAPVDDLADDEEKPGFIAGLLARFRRKDDSDEDDDYEADLVAERQEPAMGATAQPAARPKKDSTDNLLDEMGISEELLSLDDALDGIDSTHPEEAAEVFEPVADEIPAVASAAEQAEAAAKTQDSDYALAAAAEAFASIDKEAEEVAPIEFTTTEEEVVAVDVPADVEPVEADTFEFTLKDLPETESVAPVAAEPEEVETFDFKLSTPVAAAPKPAPAPEPESIEVIAFPGAKKESVPEEDDISLDLGDLSFDDTMVTDDDEPSEYKPRTGNECDTKLDLATAYEAMGDVTEAIEILDEVIAEGSPAQVETAQRLKETWQNS